MSKPLNSFGAGESSDTRGEFDSYEVFGKEVDELLDEYPEMSLDDNGYIKDFYYE